MTLTSMTGFADLAGGAQGVTWVWEARCVNGRGLDMRLRLPEGFEALEGPVRAAIGGAVRRGSVSVTLRLGKGNATAVPRLNETALEAAIAAATRAGEIAARLSLDLAPMTASDLLAVRGVLEAETVAPSETPGVGEALTAQIGMLADALRRAREAEGVEISRLLMGQIDRIVDLTRAARTTAEVRSARSGDVLRGRIEAVLAATAAVDEARLAHELAVIAVRSDVTEELDRIEAHITAAGKLLAEDGPVGRKLDFLTQEFNREANTLCSKAGATDLTAIGLEMKVVIDQMREQVQNVE